MPFYTRLEIPMATNAAAAGNAMTENEDDFWLFADLVEAHRSYCRLLREASLVESRGMPKEAASLMNQARNYDKKRRDLLSQVDNSLVLKFRLRYPTDNSV